MTREDARRILAEAGVPDPAGDVRRLWEYAFLGYGEKIGGQDRDRPNDLTLSVFNSAVKQRARRVPVSHIVQGREFWKDWFTVTPDVLDPRPDTETLIETALLSPFSRVLDLGTGTGCILISLLLERAEATGVGTDISDKALKVAAKNAKFHRVTDRLDFQISDWFGDVEGQFDLIVSNPPYIAKDEMADLQPEVRDYEPRIALTDENDGLNAYRAIAAGAPDHLTSGGRLLVEIGPTQAEAVSALFKVAGLVNITVHPDLDGRDRVVAAQKSA
ncbi:MAG: peptide chain release factor N(5)-glutamine methyltransferase [Silicimonas sp.]|nr:peptide chain release factor N(5)-glutamine methyltransferase [Silicimonas sp.]